MWCKRGVNRLAFSGLIAALVVGSAACAHAPAATTTATTSTSEPPSAPRRQKPDEIIAGFTKKHPLSAPDDPLRRPKSIVDCDAILHLDQIDLFQGAVDFLAKQQGADALTLRAQIEIAYSEAQLVVAEVIAESADGLESVIRTLRFRAESGKTSDEEKAKRAELESTFHDARDVAWALRELAADHARNGATVAQMIMASKEKSYRGYRVAADYHRLRGDWDDFAEDLNYLARENPTSNGLVFLRAIAAQAEGESDTAVKLYRDALVRDPKFVRAQAHIVLLQTSPERAHTELARLAELNPHHQLITYAGPFIEEAHKAWTAEHKNPSRWGQTTNL